VVQADVEHLGAGTTAVLQQLVAALRIAAACGNSSASERLGTGTGSGTGSGTGAAGAGMPRRT
jgi:hypothetical protein